MTDQDQNTQEGKRKEKRKNEDRQIEWTFDFSRINESVGNMLNSLAGDQEVQTSEFSLEKGGVENAVVKVDFSVGKSNINALDADSPLLLDAIIKHIGDVDFKARGTENKVISIRQKLTGGVKAAAHNIRQGFRAMASREDLSWDIGLAQGVPFELHVDGGVGPSTLDLTDLTVIELDADTGVGTLTLILPEQRDPIDVDIDGGVGQTNIYIPENAAVDLSVDGGVGTVEIVIPENAAVQLKAEGGIGSINVPRSMRRISKKEFLEAGGMWQSEGFELAERRIVIDYEGGVGTLNIREAELV